MSVIYEHTEEWDFIPFDHEYRQYNGSPSFRFLCDVQMNNRRRAKEFECALNAVCALGLQKDIKISWKIEEIDINKENEKAF